MAERSCASWPADVPAYVEAAVAVVDRAMELWPHGELALSFNGGKDCTILLGLVQLSEARRKQRFAAEGKSLSDEETSSLFTSRVRMVYFVEEGCFPEQDEFIALAQRTYGFELQRVGQHMKENTAMLVREHGVRAFLMGTRRADPYAATLDSFSPSTDGWAPFMRVNPVLQWEYDMVWQFIRDFSIPYCSLYDKGYSSVGLMKNTERNRNLVRPDGTYRPAWELDRANAGTERGGRGTSDSTTSGGSRSGGNDCARDRSAAAAAGSGKRRSIALLLASEIGPVGADGVSGEGGVGVISADELWMRVRQPLTDRNYSTNAVCTLSDGVEQWAAALAQHTQTSRVVLAVAPVPTLQLALGVAFGGNGDSDSTVTRAGANGSATAESPIAAATSWRDMLPGCALLDKNGALVPVSDCEQAGVTGERQQATSPGQIEEAVAVVYKNVVCCPATCDQSANVEAAIAAVCAAADSGGPIGLL